MVQYINAVFGVLLLSLDQSLSQYTNCSGDLLWLGDGWCSPETNHLGCGYDGGDCCECTCVDGPLYPCGTIGFNCKDPACFDPAIAIQYPECAEDKLLSVGDGLCTAENNNQACGYDGGDCCLCTCSGSICALSEFDCLDPSVGDEIYDCAPPPPNSVPCSANGQRVWVVENSAQARALAEAMNCSGGSFEVVWRGNIVVDKTIYVFDGTVLNVTGAVSIASMDGDSATRLLTVVNASVHVAGVNMSYGAGTVGGAVVAVRSNITFSGSTFLGNAATGHGGAIYASDSSVVSFVGHNSFSDNTAAMDGGAVFVMDSLCTAESVAFFNNTAGGNGGAMMISEHSSLSWSGKSTYLKNQAVRSAGAIALQSSASASWYGETIFASNSALQYAGAFHVLDASHASWNATTIFSNNIADDSGGAMRVANGSNASWSGSTMYVGNGAFGGGAMTIIGGSAAFSGGNTTFSANAAETFGGAVFVSEYSTVTWEEETTFSNNFAGQRGAVDVNTSLIQSEGGALAVFSSTVTLSGETTFADNQAFTGPGGALVVLSSTVTLSGETTFADNQAFTGPGGALAVFSSTVTLSGRTTFADNQAFTGGAVYAGESSSISWDGHAEFVDNLASSGGALNVQTSNVSWRGRTTFAHNRAYANYGGALSVLNASRVSWGGETVFLNNSCAYFGGGLFLFASSIAFDGNTTFRGNFASIGGGAVNAYQSSISGASSNGQIVFANNLAGAGGALWVQNSSALWNGKAALAHNRAYNNSGGAISVSRGSKVSWSGESTFLDNSALGFGGAAVVWDDSNMYWSGSTTFLSCAALLGGALFIAKGSAASWSGRTEFISNNALLSGGAIGSSFFSEGFNPQTSTLVVDGSTSFANNTAGSTGGGLALNGMLHVTFQSPDVLFIGNSANVVGGAVFVSDFGVGPVFSAVRFVANFAGAGGGVYITGSGNENLDDFAFTPVHATKFDGCEFVDNRATTTGGAFESSAGQDHISNTSFKGNTAAIGGALRLGGRTFLDDCSFVDNRSGEGAGPAVDNIGHVGRIANSSFIGNVFDCRPGTYLDFNESGNAYEVACNGCRVSCQGCTFEESLVAPICVQAMEHSTSSGGASTLETVSIKRGFWRATSTSKEILACYRDDVCLGGVTGTPGYCRNGYEGPYCSICSDGHAASFGFACDQCSDKAGGSVLMGVLVVFVLIGAAAIASYTMSSQPEGEGRGIIQRVTRFIPLQSIKIVIVALQIVTQFTTIANVTYPHVYQRFLDTVNVLNFDLGWLSLLSAGCLFDIGIHGRLLIATIGPIVAAMFLGLTYVVAAKGTRGSAEALHLIRHKHTSMMLLLTFLVYSSVSSILFQMFACDDLEDGKKYLRADYRVECDSSKHRAYQIFAGCMILLYTVGIPALYTSLLFREVAVLKDEVGREESPSTQSFSHLWKPYKPSIFYYEVIECGRRVLLTGAVVFIYPNTSAQIAVTLMIAFIFAMMSEGLAPFTSKWDTWISRMGHVVVFVSMYVALLLKVDVSNERSRNQKVFEGVLVAAYVSMMLGVIIETGVMVCSLRHAVQESMLPRVRGTK